MVQSNTTWKIVALLVASVILISALTYANHVYAVSNPGGNDFLVHWVGARSFLQDGISPYSDTVALRIQTIVYGRAAEPGEHELRVAYPLYSILLFLPFSWITDFNWARAAWMTVLELALIAALLMSHQIMEWKPRRWLLALLLTFSLLWYHAMRPVILGNVVILQMLGVVGLLLALKKGENGTAGFLLALITVKPQVALLPVVFVLIWSVYRRRWQVATWFLSTLFFLAAFATLLLPSWWIENLREIVKYPAYNPPGSLSSILALWVPTQGQRIGTVLSALIAFILVIEWWRFRKADYQTFLWVFCLTLVLGQWVGLQNDPGNFIMLFFPLIYLFATWSNRWQRGGMTLTLVTMGVLMFGLWGLFLATVERSYQPIQSPVMFFPLPGIVVILLYWMRWWATHYPMRLSPGADSA
jgi:hypothetical protein